MRRVSWPLVASFVATAAAATAMVMLPGRTSAHGRVDRAEAAAPPTADGFHLDGLRWDIERLKNEPRMAPFRAFMQTACPGLEGLAAAVCVSDEFSRRFPNTAPKHEFLDASYDPVADLAQHLAGDPGHCVTRSGLESTVLLASGISARQVQITGGLGHNVLEVYDAKRGWVIFDPTFGVTYASPDRPGKALSVADAVIEPRVIPVSVGLPSTGLSDAPHEIPEALYPDPWLYTRVGERAARWPFRGMFVHVGHASLRYGLGQQLARTSFVFFAILTTALFTLRKRRARQEAKAASLRPEPVAATSPEA